MQALFKNFFASIPIGTRVLVLIFLLTFPLQVIGTKMEMFNFYGWFGLRSDLVWSGHAWRVLTFGLLPAGPADWLFGGFWLATLASIFGRNWRSLEFWGYCLLGNLGGAIPVVALRPDSAMLVVGSGSMIFALLVAWDSFFRYERLLLLGIGEMSVRQAAILLGIANSVIVFFSCGGWFMMVSMWGGGVAGWLYLFIRRKLVMGKTGRQVGSERISRLEL